MRERREGWGVFLCERFLRRGGNFSEIVLRGGGWSFSERDRGQFQ